MTGPESSGKTAWAKRLAVERDGVFVEEYARHYLQQLARPYERADLDAILIGQLAAEEAMAQRYRLVVCDTGPLVLQIWSEVKYGLVSPRIAKAVREQQYDEIWLCYPDLQWEPDPLRETPDFSARIQLFERYENLLRSTKRPYRIKRSNKRPMAKEEIGKKKGQK